MPRRLVTGLTALATALLLVLSLVGASVVQARTKAVESVVPSAGTYRYRSVATITSGTAPSTTTDRTERRYALQYEPLTSSGGETRLRRRSEIAGYQDKAWRDDGIYDIAETYTSAGGERTCLWKPARLAIRFPVRVRSTWESNSTCTISDGAGSDVMERAESGTVKRRTTHRVGDRRLDVFEMETRTTSRQTIRRGAVVTTVVRKERSTLLFAPSIGVVVHANQRVHAESRVAGQTARVEIWSDSTDELLTPTPEA